MYTEIVLDHFQNPRNLHELKDASAVGMGASRVCGDVMTLYLKTKGEEIVDASFKIMGCGAAIASGSMLTGLLKGKTLSDARAITAGVLLKALGGLPNIKLHCPDLAVEALGVALKDHDAKVAAAK
jgi:nitrogen fixation NifU-like protein